MVHLFIDLLLSANHEPKIWKGIKIDRGQVVVSRRKLSKKLGISEQKIRTCLSTLESTHEITHKSTHQYTIITIVKYDKYQIVKKNQPTKPPQNTHKSTTTKEDKELKEDKENTYDDKSSRLEITLKGMPINLEDLNDGDVTYEEEFKKTPKKYKGKTKAYARIAVKYLQMREEGGNVLRYFPDIKELWDFASKNVAPDKIEAEIIARIEAFKKQQESKNLDWSLSGVVKNWNKILRDYKE
jgi:predicted ArsR family transcriptional regulator